MRANFIFFFLSLFSIFSVQASNIANIKNKLVISQTEVEIRGKNELARFSNLWDGGYYEGNPLDKHSSSSYYYKAAGNLSPLYVCFINCIKPFVNKSTNVLEIGPGRGAWTKAILHNRPKTVICVDALSAEYNKFWEYIGNRKNVTYHKVEDFSLSCIDDNSIDYVFSFGVFCHISPLMIHEYLKNLFPKLKKGAKCFIQYADYDKYNNFSKKYCFPDMPTLEKVSVEKTFTDQKESCWYHLGTSLAKEILTECGYTDINTDVQVNERDPIMYFVKP